jgi:hypothetical protein
MCGLFGWDVKHSVSKKQLLSLALTLTEANDKRGGDSFGYLNVRSGHVHRDLGEGVFEAHVMSNFTRIMGHTRKATTGAKTVANAHPFEIGDIIGAHNGMISEHIELNKKYERNHEVDSMHIFSHINEGKALDELSGYGTITWTDKRAGRSVVFMCKLRNGDLAVARLKNGGGCVWSSAEFALTRSLKIAGLEYTLVDVKESEVLFTDGSGEVYVQADTKLSIKAPSYATYTGQSHSYHPANSYHGSSYYGSLTDLPEWEEDSRVTSLVKKSNDNTVIIKRDQRTEDIEAFLLRRKKLEEHKEEKERKKAEWEEYNEAKAYFHDMVVMNFLGVDDDFPKYKEWRLLSAQEQDNLVPTEDELSNRMSEIIIRNEELKNQNEIKKDA